MNPYLAIPSNTDFTFKIIIHSVIQYLNTILENDTILILNYKSSMYLCITCNSMYCRHTWSVNNNKLCKNRLLITLRKMFALKGKYKYPINTSSVIKIKFFFTNSEWGLNENYRK